MLFSQDNSTAMTSTDLRKNIDLLSRFAINSELNRSKIWVGIQVGRSIRFIWLSKTFNLEAELGNYIYVSSMFRLKYNEIEAFRVSVYSLEI